MVDPQHIMCVSQPCQWSKYLIGCSEDEALVALALNQLREMTFGPSTRKEFSKVKHVSCREGLFDGVSVKFVTDRKSFPNCLPHHCIQNYITLSSKAARRR